MNSKGRPFILLNFSKTDQFGTGTVIPISDHLFELIERWQKKIGTESGYILRPVNKGGRVGEHLDPSSVSRLLKDLQDQVNENNTSAESCTSQLDPVC